MLRERNRFSASSFLNRNFLHILIASSFLAFLSLPIFPEMLPASSFADNNTPTVTPSISIGNNGILDLTVNPGTFNSASQSVTVATTNYTGYTLTMSPTSGVSTDLVKGNENIPTITLPAGEETITSSGFTGASYGLSTDGTNYKPVTSGMGIKSTQVSGTDNLSITLGAKALTTTSAGQYAQSFTLTAVANPIVYSVTFNANAGGSTVGNMPSSPQTTGMVSGTNLTLASETPTRTGYSFLGWSTNSSASTATYSAGGTYTLDETTSNTITLYAIWQVNNYTCSKQYRLQNADGTFPSTYTSDTSEQVAYGTTCTYTKTATDYRGNSSAANGAQGSTSGTMTENGLTLSIDFYRNQYTCSKQYHLQNADASYPSSYTTDGSETLPWGATCNYSKTVTDYQTQSTSATMGKENKTLSLELPRNTYTLTVSGSSDHFSSTSGGGTYRWGQTVSISATPKTGHSFTSWSQSGTSGTFGSTSSASTTFTMGKGAATVTASGQTNSYTCTKQYRLQNADGTFPSTYTADGTSSVAYGSTCSYSKTVADYRGSSSAANGAQGSTSCTMGTNGCTLSIDFYRNTYTLTINRNTTYISSVSGGGSGKLWGSSVSISATPASIGFFTGWSQTAGTTGSFASTSNASTTFTMPKSNATIYADGSKYLQDWNGCSSMSVGKANAITLYDKRDEQAYTVTKYNMGNNTAKCWMSNLNLGAEPLVVSQLDNTNTNLASGVSPISATTFTSDWIKATDSWTFYYPEVVTITTSNSDNGSIADSYGNKYGTLYNYAAASAGTITGNTNSGDATSSLCPSGWRLPSSGPNGEMEALTTANAITNDVTGVTALQSDFGFPLAGTLYIGAGNVANQGEEGHYWSSTRLNDTRMYELFIYHTSYSSRYSFDNGKYNGRNFGSSIRCISQ